LKTNNDVIIQIYPIIKSSCYGVPYKSKEDVEHDIALALLTELYKIPAATFDEKVAFCLSRVKNYKTKFAKKYRNTAEVSLEDTIGGEFKDYSITMDIDFIYNNLNLQQRKLFKFILDNGIDCKYKEIASFMGYKDESGSLQQIRTLLHRINEILGSDKKNSCKNTYFRYKKM
jgi:hypothetical protein